MSDVDPKDQKKKKINYGNAWEEARGLIWHSRGRLSLGLGLMLINRLTGLVLPASTKFLVDDVNGKNQPEMLWPPYLRAGTLGGQGLSPRIGRRSSRAIARAATLSRRWARAARTCFAPSAPSVMKHIPGRR